ncbi:hypothetical protein Zm00014a_031156 [Zea mays]|uniref:Uncharacterized protein n=1 Tax=Zea mays TaxID=4577 RepID=A0A3L6DAH7_MAIZE|nr:hypothetical protein Zm00014a_031156 [Zea mays]
MERGPPPPMDSPNRKQGRPACSSLTLTARLRSDGPRGIHQAFSVMSTSFMKSGVLVQEGFTKPFQSCQEHHVRPQGEGDRHGNCFSLPTSDIANVFQDKLELQPGVFALLL